MKISKKMAKRLSTAKWIAVACALAGLPPLAYTAYKTHVAKMKYAELLAEFEPAKKALAECSLTGSCISYGKFAAVAGEPGDTLRVGRSPLPLPASDTDVVKASATVVDVDGRSLTIKLTPRLGAPAGIKPADTAILKATYKIHDGSVEYELSGGCKTRPGGSIC